MENNFKMWNAGKCQVQTCDRGQVLGKGVRIFQTGKKEPE